MENLKEFKKELQERQKKESFTLSIDMTLYNKGNNNNWYCDIYAYDYKNYIQTTTKATGYGYDKHSTALSNGINLFKEFYTRYNRKAKSYKSYGLDDNNIIDYGIGSNAVLNCLKCFKNVKIKEWHEGRREDHLLITVDILGDAKNEK